MESFYPLKHKRPQKIKIIEPLLLSQNLTIKYPIDLISEKSSKYEKNSQILHPLLLF